MRSQFIPLLDVPWEYRVELTFTDEALRSLRNSHLMADPSRMTYTKFIRQIAVALGLNIGAAHVFVEAGHDARPHAHVLLIGRDKAGRVLSSFTVNQIAKCWPYGVAHVQRVDVVEAAVGYLEANCRQGKDSFNLSGYRVLEQWMPSQPPQKRGTHRKDTPPWD